MIIKSLKIKNNNIFKEINNINNFNKKIEFLSRISKYLYKINNNLNEKNNIIICNNKIFIKILKKKKNIYMYSYSDSIIIRGLISLIFFFFNNKNIFIFKNKKKYNFLFFQYIKKYNIIIKNINIIYNIKNVIDNKFYILFKNL